MTVKSDSSSNVVKVDPSMQAVFGIVSLARVIRYKRRLDGVMAAVREARATNSGNVLVILCGQPMK